MERLFLKSQRGQGMTEYIIIVALIAIGAVGVYTAFGDVVRGQTSIAASTLGGQTAAGARTIANNGATAANNRAKAKTLKDFESATK